MFVVSVSEHSNLTPVTVIWNACTGQVVYQWSRAPQAPLLDRKYPVFVVFSPNSTLILFLDYLLDELEIRSTDTGELIRTFQGVRGGSVPYNNFKDKQWSLDGVILCWEAYTVAIYDCFQNEIHIYHIDHVCLPIRQGSVRLHSAYHPVLTLSRSGRWLCVIDKYSRTGYVADTLSSCINIDVSSFPQASDGPEPYSNRRYLAASFDESEKTLITVTYAGQVLRWSIPRKCYLGAVDLIGVDRKRHNLSHACLSGDGSRIAWVPVDGHAEGTVLCGRLAGEEFVVLKQGRHDSSILLSQDGEYVAVVPSLWSHQPLSVFRVRDRKRVFQDVRLIRKPHVSFGGCRSGQGTLACGLGDGTVEIVRLCDVDVEQ